MRDGGEEFIKQPTAARLQLVNLRGCSSQQRPAIPERYIILNTHHIFLLIKKITLYTKFKLTNMKRQLLMGRENYFSCFLLTLLSS
jgi:hypothetical protein